MSISGLPVFDKAGRFIGYRGVARDITERKRAAEALREAQMQLAHANRVATMGQLTASIAHEVNQPIAATVTNAQAALRWLGAEPPNLDEVRQALGRIVRDGDRAGAVVGRIRDLIKKAPPRDERVEINAAIREVIELTRSEAMKNGVLVQTELVEGLPLVRGDRVELQQVILNLILNAIEAMSETSEGPRELLITTGKTESDDVLVAVRDSGPGLAPAALEHLFKAFHTTKPNGLGLGLSICRSIIEGARRTIVGERQFAPRRGLSIHAAGQSRRRSASVTFNSDPCPLIWRSNMAHATRGLKYSFIGPVLHCRRAKKVITLPSAARFRGEGNVRMQSDAFQGEATR